MDWSKIHWMQFDSSPPNLIPLLETFLVTLQDSLVPVTFEAIRFAALVASVDVLLFSGSEARMTQISSFKPPVPMICMSNAPLNVLRRPALSTAGLKLHRWRHRMLGGVTNGNLLVGCRNIDFSGFKPPLRRTVKHILEFSTRPESCQESPSFRHYKSTDVIRMNELSLPVVFKSPHFCRTGWGSRQLTLGELACAFDLPSHCVAAIDDSALLSQLFPLKLMTEPLQFVLEGLATGRRLVAPAKVYRNKDLLDLKQDASVSVSAVAAHFAKMSAVPNLKAVLHLAQSQVPLFLNGLPNPAGPGVPGKRIWFRDPPGMTWLPELGKFLPDTWCDESLISDKAVKADADPVPEHLWTNRTTLVIPSATNSTGFQTLALLWQRKAMYKQLRRFLALRHGPEWPSVLANIRRRTAQAAIRAVGPPPRKRSRGGVTTG
jgi:hypothetical protein